MLDKDSATMAAYVCVTSILDYGNSQLCGLPKTKSLFRRQQPEW